MASRLTNEDIINRIIEVHGDLYDLSRVNYINRRTKIELICKKHGSWFSYTEQLFRGQGCPVCGKKQAGKTRRIGFNDFVEKANQVHNNKYKYFKEGYVKFSSKLKIECPEHGLFSQRANDHIHQVQGCPKCGIIKNAEKRSMNVGDFISRSNSVHENKYDYSKVVYKNNNTKVLIICPIHGSFKQEPQNHLNGSGCLKCSLKEQVLRQTKSLKDFIIDSKLIHGNKYDYSKVTYINSLTNVIIKCKKHGEFSQNPVSHQSGSGCPNCNISRGEEKVKRILESHNISFEQQYTFEGLVNINYLKCDFFLPKFNTVIEFNGRQHYEPVFAFGGKNAFEETKFRDKLKRDFFNDQEINLLEIHHKDKNIESTIIEFLSNKNQ